MKYSYLRGHTVILCAVSRPWISTSWSFIPESSASFSSFSFLFLSILSITLSARLKIQGAASKALRCFGIPFYRTCGTEVMTTTSHNWISIMFPTNEASKRNIFIRVVDVRFIFDLLLGSFSQFIKLPAC